MASPRVPGEGGESLELPCGRTIALRDIDLGMHEYPCDCGSHHAVVLDVHPPSRFVPESIVDILREAIESADEFGPFGTPHIMGFVMEEFPDSIATKDASEDGMVGFSMVWISDFDSRRLHGIIVELLIELMDHAVSHSDDESTVSTFEELMERFDVDEFVDSYRAARDFEDEFDQPL